MEEDRVVVLAAKTGSKLIAGKSHITDYYVEGRDQNGRPSRYDHGASNYKDERWFDSLQTKGRPEYSIRKGMFELVKEDGSCWTQLDADAACDALRLSYEKKSDKRYGETIKECNIRDVADPFFNHTFWKRQAKENELRLNLNEHGMGPIVDAIRGSEFVGTARKGDPTSGRVREILSDVKADAAYEAEQVDNTMDAFELFGSLNAAKRRLIFRALGNLVDENVDDAVIKKDLFKRYVTDDVTLEDGYTRQQLFVRYAKMLPRDLQIRETVIVGVKRGVILQRGGAYEYSGGQIGTSIGSVEAHFKNNHKAFESLYATVHGKMLSEAETEAAAAETPEEKIE